MRTKVKPKKKKNHKRIVFLGDVFNIINRNVPGKLTLQAKPGIVSTTYFAKKYLLFWAVQLFAADEELQQLDIKLPFPEAEIKKGREVTRHKIARLQVSRSKLEFRMQVATASDFAISLGWQNCFSGKLSDYGSKRKTDKLLESFILNHQVMVEGICGGNLLMRKMVKIKTL